MLQPAFTCNGESLFSLPYPLEYLSFWFFPPGNAYGSQVLAVVSALHFNRGDCIQYVFVSSPYILL